MVAARELGWSSKTTKQKEEAKQIVENTWADFGDDFVLGRELEFALAKANQLGGIEVQIYTEKVKNDEWSSTKPSETVTLHGRIDVRIGSGSLWISCKGSAVGTKQINLSRVIFYVSNGAKNECFARVQYPYSLPPGWSSLKDSNTNSYVFVDHVTNKRTTSVPSVSRDIFNTICLSKFGISFDAAVEKEYAAKKSMPLVCGSEDESESEDHSSSLFGEERFNSLDEVLCTDPHQAHKTIAFREIMGFMDYWNVNPEWSYWSDYVDVMSVG